MYRYELYIHKDTVHRQTQYKQIIYNTIHNTHICLYVIHLCIPISVGEEVRFAILSNLNMKPEIKQLDLALKYLQPIDFSMP